MTARRRPPTADVRVDRAGVDREQRRMPPLALLEPVRWSTETKLGMLALRGYLVVGAVLLVVKAVQLGRQGVVDFRRTCDSW